MAKKKFGNSFSDVYGIPAEWFKKNKVFNPTLDADSQLFIDPFLLPKSKHPEFAKSGFLRYEAHFSNICNMLLGSEELNDKLWKAALRQLRFSEDRGMGGTCLGYSKTTRGSGWGPKLSGQALVWAKSVVSLGVKDPEFFSAMSVFEDGIGPDRISDMVANIILDDMLAFNARILAKIEKDTKVKVPLKPDTIRGQAVRLPRNKFSGKPIILVPSDVLKHLPMWNESMSLKDVVDHNEALRARVNKHLGDIFKARTKDEKAKIKAQAMESAESFQALLDLLKLLEEKPYDVFKDPQGIIAWRDQAHIFSATNRLEIKDDKSLTEIERVEHVCTTIINQFTSLIEKKRMNRIFFVDEDPRPEKFAQMLFYTLAIAYVDANNLDMSPESDGGTGPVDFKFSRGKARVVVEIKLSTNTQAVSGFQKQLEAYRQAEDAQFGHYVLIDVGKIGEKWKRLSEIAATDKKFAKLNKLHLIDGTLKPSASKRG